MKQNHRETHVKAIRDNADVRMTGRFVRFPVIIDSRKVEGILTTTDLLGAFQELQYIVETAQK